MCFSTVNLATLTTGYIYSPQQGAFLGCLPKNLDSKLKGKSGPPLPSLHTFPLPLYNAKEGSMKKVADTAQRTAFSSDTMKTA